MFRLLIKFIVIIVEKFLDWFAMVAAFMSVAQAGDIVARMIGTLVSLYHTGYGFISAYMKNENFNDAWSRFTQAFDAGMAVAADNIQKNPQTVLVVFVLTFVCFKLVAWILRRFRKDVLKRRPKVIKPKKGKKSPTYDRLYEPPELQPSTQAYLEKTREEKSEPPSPPPWKRED